MLDNIVFRKLAVDEPDRLVHIEMRIVEGPWGNLPSSIVERLKERADLFSGVSGSADKPAWKPAGPAIALVVRSDADILRVIGVRPALGRLLSASDQGPVAVISEHFWRDRLGADPAVLGQTVRAGTTVLTVVGVVPDSSGMIANVRWDVTTPLRSFIDPHSTEGRARVWLDTVARLQPGVSIEAARAQVQATWTRLVADTAPTGRSPDEWAKISGRTALVEPASRGRFYWRAQYQGPLELLLGMAGLLLLLVCSNLATVLLARAISREKEMTIRLALGATRGRLVRASLLEALLLSSAGTALGLIVTRWSSAFSVAFLPAGNVPLHYDLALNGRALVFALALALFTAVACGVFPALRAGRAHGTGALQRRGLLVVQVALSSMLVTASLLFTTTLSGLGTTRLGFDADRVLAFSIQGKPGAVPAGYAYFDELQRRLSALPGVERVSIANELPCSIPPTARIAAAVALPVRR